VAIRYEGFVYRALVLSEANNQGGFYVEFLDFGYRTVCHECRKLPDYLVNLPAMAIRCRLANESDMFWTVPKAECFRYLCFANDWLDIRVIDTNYRCMTVQLYLNGRTIDEIIETEFTSVANQVGLYQPFPIMPSIV
jgi:Tudor domain